VRGKRVGGSGGEGKRVGVSAGGVSAFRGKRIGGSARGVSALGAWRSAFSGLSVW
jgi:hypothetical protein